MAAQDGFVSGSHRVIDPPQRHPATHKQVEYERDCALLSPKSCHHLLPDQTYLVGDSQMVSVNWHIASQLNKLAASGMVQTSIPLSGKASVLGKAGVRRYFLGSKDNLDKSRRPHHITDQQKSAIQSIPRKNSKNRQWNKYLPVAMPQLLTTAEAHSQPRWR
ncbi:uncharacterized protein H6S33_005158 [Morchella sextelata]|uniref:uncharacterized protein n=1 Tax=Morchella sextelata TaxID=1174677 RepID=UPI001D055CDE|nr:uncharacterized protein H6S33_005158 [Morchella sextelata]KAH0605176.1 hypothetical protein H6S33_005158 [Morchella sextelata]